MKNHYQYQIKKRTTESALIDYNILKLFLAFKTNYLKNFHFGIIANIPNPVKRKRLVTSVYKKVDK